MEWGRRAVAATGRLLGALRTAANTRRGEGHNSGILFTGHKGGETGPRTTSPCDGGGGGSWCKQSSSLVSDSCAVLISSVCVREEIRCRGKIVFWSEEPKL